MTDKVQKIREEVKRMHNLLPVADGDNIYLNYADRICTTLEMYIDSLQEEPVSEDLEKAAEQDVCEVVNTCSSVGIPNDHIPSWVQDAMVNEFIHGAKWQKKQDQETIELAEDHAMLAGMEKMKEQMMANIWKPADGDDLPDIDREVIALLANGKVVFAHRPPEYWDGKDIVTGKVTRNYPKTYDKGGWNIPNVKYWLDCLMPKEIEL